MWDRLLANFPVLFRILTYIYSPPDDFETRMKMLALWIKADESRNDLRTPQIIHELNHCWSLFNHPEISEYSIISDFLQNLNSDFDSVFINDLRKVGGEESTIQNLRDTWIITEENENRKKTIFNMSPWFRAEHFKKISGEYEFHYYVLDNSETDRLFTNADAELVQWLQYFPDGCPGEKNKITVFIYGPDGELVKPPGKHINPFPFNLMEKYYGLIKKESHKAFSRQDPYEASKLKRQEVESRAVLAFVKAAKEWRWDRLVIAHLNTYLPFRIQDIFYHCSISIKTGQYSSVFRHTTS